MKSDWLRFRRAFQNGWHNLMRNKLLTAATLLIITLIFFVFNVVLALRFATDSVIDRVSEKIDIGAELLPGVEDYTTQTFIAKLQGHPAIKEVVYVSKEDALKRFGVKYPNVIAFLSDNGLENPLPDVIRLVSFDVEDNNKILQYLAQPEFSGIVNQEKLLLNQEQKTRNERVLDVTRFIRQVGFFLNATFALVAVLILFNSITLNIHAHKTEIAIMRLVGARRRFIAAGFLFEGVLVAVTALFLSFFFSQLLLRQLAASLLSVIQNESLLVGLNAILMHFQDQFFFTFAWQTLFAAAVGLLSSALAVGIYLKKRFSFS